MAAVASKTDITVEKDTLAPFTGIVLAAFALAALGCCGTLAVQQCKIYL